MTNFHNVFPNTQNTVSNALTTKFNDLCKSARVLFCSCEISFTYAGDGYILPLRRKLNPKTEETTRERPKSAPYLRLKNSKRTSKYQTIGELGTLL